jgi:murein DD-endopeptidase MepM/ murein hydrolase activator NlpD
LEFGQSDLPYQPIHTGMDIASPNHKVGDPVVAFMAGTVIHADIISWGFGRHVEIDNGHHITSIYAHLDSLTVTKGQEVKAGTVIGTRGSTGWSTGPHLHFQINVYGIPVNPRTFLGGSP